MKPIKIQSLLLLLLSQSFAQETTVLDEIKVSTENSNYSIILKIIIPILLSL